MSIDIPFNKIALFCSKWQVCEFSLFGSVLRDRYGHRIKQLDYSLTKQHTIAKIWVYITCTWLLQQ